MRFRNFLPMFVETFLLKGGGVKPNDFSISVAFMCYGLYKFQLVLISGSL